jgi:hypothetical protein
MSAQAIAGVSATTEAKIMTVSPSIAGIAPGRLIGRLMDLIPVNVFGMRLSRLLFGLPLAPLGALLFLLTKGLGPRYVLTNRSVQIWNSAKTRRQGGVELSEIDSVQIDQLPGQAYFRAADIRLVAASGKTLLRLSGVAEVNTFAHAIQSAIDSRSMVQASLSAIAARGDG